MLSDLFIGPSEDRLLEAAEKASEVDIEKHRRMAYFSRPAKFKEVVFEELVAFHESHHTSTTLDVFLVSLIPDEN